MGAAFRTLNRSYEAGHAIGVVVGVVAAVLAAGAGAAFVPQATATSERIRSVSALLMCRTLPERGRALAWTEAPVTRRLRRGHVSSL